MSHHVRYQGCHITKPHIFTQVDDWWSKFYFVVIITVFFFIPLLILVVLYVYIASRFVRVTSGRLFLGGESRTFV